MTNRILFTAGSFRISKPGYDVLTETNPQNLIVDGTYAGLGMYATGTATISGNTKTTISYSNVTGSIPFVLLQYSRGSDSVGGGFYYQSSTTSYLEDTTPATRVYETTPNSSVCLGFDVYVSTSNIYVWNKDTSSRTFRYVIFYPSMAGTTGGSYDMVPDSANWTDISGAADAFTPIGGNTQTISGIGGPITLRLRAPSTLTTNQSIRVAINGSYVTTLSDGSSSVTFSVNNGDTIGFSYLGSAGFSGTMNVDNISTGTNGIDTFSISASAAPDYDISNTFTNKSVSGNSSGGTSFIISDQNFTIAGINTTATLQITTNRSMDTSVTEVIQVYRNSSLITTLSSGSSSSSFTVSNGDAITLRHAAMGAVSIVINIQNLTVGSFSEGSYNSSISDAAPPVDYTPSSVNWPDIAYDSWGGVNAFYSQYANGQQQTLTGFNQTISMRFAVSSTPPSGVTLYFAKNNASYVAILDSGTATYADFTAVVGDVFDIRAGKTSLGNYTGTVTITNLSTSTVMDTSTIQISKNSGPEP